jgi:NADH-quinone oxidoreductase subunit J
MEMFLFYFFGGGLLFVAFLTVMFRNPMHSVLSMIASFFFMSGIYLTLSMQFLAVMQIMVYAGAIMILFLFVIMLFDLRRQEFSKDKFSPVFDITAIVVVLAGGAWLIKVILSSKSVSSVKGMKDVPTSFGGVDSVAHSIFGTAGQIGNNSFIFESISVLLLAAIIGAVVMAKG